MDILSVNDFLIGNVQVQHESPVLSASAVNWKETVITRGLHRLKITFDLVLTNDHEQRLFHAFMLRRQGRAEPFLLDFGTDRVWSNPFSYDAAVTLSGAHGANVSTLVLAESNLIEPGTYFTVANDSKVYCVVSSQAGNITIWPSLRQSAVAGAALNFINPRPLVRLDSDNFKTVHGERGTSISLAVTEVMR